MGGVEVSGVGWREALKTLRTYFTSVALRYFPPGVVDDGKLMRLFPTESTSTRSSYVVWFLVYGVVDC